MKAVHSSVPKDEVLSASRYGCGAWEGEMPKALYIAYLTGVAGQSVGLFYIGDGIVAGVDAGTMQYNGAYTQSPDGTKEGAVEYVIPGGMPLITGSPANLTPTRITVKLTLPAGFDDGRVVSIETPLGPVNARFEKVRDIP